MVEVPVSSVEEALSDSFTALYHSTYPSLQAFLARRVPPDAVDDLAQAVWLRSWRAWGRYQDRGYTTGWLLFIARNVVRSYYRDMASRVAPTPLTEDPVSSVDVERSVLARIDLMEVVHRVRRLPPAERRSVWVALAAPRHRTSAEKAALGRARRALREVGGQWQ